MQSTFDCRHDANTGDKDMECLVHYFILYDFFFHILDYFNSIHYVLSVYDKEHT